MKNFLDVRKKIYEFECENDYLLNLPDDTDTFDIYCVLKDLLQDTGEAIGCHMQRGFSDSPMLAYIEFWGIMQAIIIQQDAIMEFYVLLFDKQSKNDKSTELRKSNASWFKLRDMRNSCSGHPANQGSSLTRTSMGRGAYFINYDLARCTSYPRGEAPFEEYKLIEMILEYEGEAVEVLKLILTEMKSKHQASRIS
jgi:hypothetical protein